MRGCGTRGGRWPVQAGRITLLDLGEPLVYHTQGALEGIGVLLEGCGERLELVAGHAAGIGSVFLGHAGHNEPRGAHHKQQHVDDELHPAIGRLAARLLLLPRGRSGLLRLLHGIDGPVLGAVDVDNRSLGGAGRCLMRGRSLGGVLLGHCSCGCQQANGYDRC